MKFFLIFLVSFNALGVFAQSASPYILHTKTESYIAGYSLVGIGAYVYLQSKTSPLTPTQIAELNAQNINAFDRYATQNYSDKIAKTSDLLVPASCILSVAIPGLIAFQKSQNSKEFWNHSSTLAVLCLEANMLSLVTNNVVKYSVLRNRPYTYNADVSIDKKLKKDARQSFYSGHTSFVATNSFFGAQVISDYYPKTWMSYSAWGIAATLPAIVGYMRVESGRHFPTDVITGYVLGAISGIAVPYLHKNNSAVTVGLASPQVFSFSLQF